MNTRHSVDIDNLNMDIMNIPVQASTLVSFRTDEEMLAYKMGHHDAINSAVDVVLEYEKNFRIRSWYVPGASAYYVTKATIPEHLKDSAIALYELENK